MDIVNRAIEFAAKAHRNQVRKGTNTPYITHPYAIGLMLTRAAFDPEVVAAGLLHDTVEDTDTTLEDIRELFGERVARVVEGASEPDKGARWEERKEHTIHYLRTATYEVRAVACADKLHNLSTIADDYVIEGEAVWSRFHRDRAAQEWYYRSLLDSLCNHIPPGQPPLPFCAEFSALVESVFGA
jgi:(p)ppGpp synthase/HD superfamily hydrolase